MIFEDFEILEFFLMKNYWIRFIMLFSTNAMQQIYEIWCHFWQHLVAIGKEEIESHISR